MELISKHQIYYSNKALLPLSDIAESLMALEKLIKQSPRTIERFFPGLKIHDVEVYLNELQSGSLFDDILGRIKFLVLVNFEKIFGSAYIAPRRDPRLGHYSMAVGILMLLFIGFNRICHFAYVQLDAMRCGFFRLEKLPVVGTFWRHVDSMGINRGKSLLTVMSILRERVWKQLDLHYGRISISIDTTVETR